MLVSNHLKGILLATAGVLIISPDSLLIRFLPIDLWSVMFLRGLFIALTLIPLVWIMMTGFKTDHSNRVLLFIGVEFALSVLARMFF